LVVIAGILAVTVSVSLLSARSPTRAESESLPS
jgi:hypothetical protein